MTMLIGSSGTGKTRDLVEQAAKVCGTIVCDNVSRMAEKVRCYGYSGLEIINYNDFISEERWKDKTKQYFVKKAEDLLQLMNIRSCTITND